MAAAHAMAPSLPTVLPPLVAPLVATPPPPPPRKRMSPVLYGQYATEEDFDTDYLPETGSEKEEDDFSTYGTIGASIFVHSNGDVNHPLSQWSRIKKDHNEQMDRVSEPYWNTRIVDKINEHLFSIIAEKRG